MNLSVGFTAKITPVKPVNDEMTLCKCYIMCPGRNVNKSDIVKEAVDDALPTLFNIPVVGHIFVDEEDEELRMGGHDKEIKKDANGKYYLRSLTVPYGTVPYQDNVHYEEVEEKDGSIKTYQVADIILWTGRYPQLLDTKYDDDIYFNQSMEIKPLETVVDKDGYTVVKKFRYSALCLMGKSDDPDKNVRPCFPSARVEPYHFSTAENWEELFEEFKSKLADSYGLKPNFEKGGQKLVNLENIESILREFGIESVEQLSFEITEDMTEEMLRERLTEMSANGEPSGEGEPAGEPAGEPTTEPQTGTDGEGEAGTGEPEGEPTGEGEFTDNSGSGEGEPAPQFQFELTNEETRRALCNAISALCEWNDVLYKSYWLCDFDSQHVYVGYYFASDEGTVDGYARFAYSKTENDIALNADSFEKVRLVWMTLEEAEKLDKERAEYAELVEYKRAKQEAEKKQEYAAVIAEFSDLSDVEEYQTVVSNAMDFASAEDLKEKLYAVRGKSGIVKKRDVSEVRIPILSFAKDEKTITAEEEFFSKYLPDAIKK